MADDPMGTAAESLTTSRVRPAGLHRRAYETEARALLDQFEEGFASSSEAWSMGLLARAVRDLLERVERLESEH